MTQHIFKKKKYLDMFRSIGKHNEKETTTLKTRVVMRMIMLRVSSYPINLYKKKLLFGKPEEGSYRSKFETSFLFSLQS